ncbi:protein O-GlcNAcase-like [Saccoglossus kowalevskii]|uniref:Bifunctional protein NCOAT-like n=1 Tax=Saccoglossus kowalevskii TaxID=10224 RepID=A0ABM0N102_SACKO|nr:PREDICTED: bifunctional protein NCOAT-like [Saccoglossus kowalevskii]
MSSMPNGSFLCGVVEGFYGRPWSTDQRIRLFQLQSKLNLKHYMYAPKDDSKHRACWRDMYSVEEADHLTSLISAAKENNVQFIYALSPGLDITFSSVKEVTCLKRKLEQVKDFGCEVFALLFDDIETDMCTADKEIFQSFAHAQVSVTNEVYQHLGQPTFLFCPTEYCGTRAVPDVANSEYLTTIGNKLLSQIHVLWTGPKVVSKFISAESIVELKKVLKRPPVIWDNIHANDYDQKRLFLGPYCGRSTELIPHLSGILTNPNCEYEANFIPIHTLATWCSFAHNQDGRKEVFNELCNATINADIKLEREGESSNCLSPRHGSYDPQLALKIAIKDWLHEFTQSRSSTGKAESKTFSMAPSPESQLPATGVSTCMSVTPTTDSLNPSPSVSTQLMTEAQNALRTLEVMSVEDASVDEEEKVEPMDITADGSTMKGSENVHVPTKISSVMMTNCSTTVNKVSDIPMQLSSNAAEKPNYAEKIQAELISSNETAEPQRNSMFLEIPTFEDIELLVDTFFLPYEHGLRAVYMLEELHWLKTHAFCVTESKHSKHPPPMAVEWGDRACMFANSCQAVNRLFQRLTNIPNRSLLYELYPYVWDMKGVVSLLHSFVKWLVMGQVPQISCDFMQATLTWCTKGYKEIFMSGDLEPWVFRGGLTAELQRMLPIDGAADLFVQKPPEKLSSKVYTIRPYLPKDEVEVYKVCRLTCDDGSDGTDIFPDHPNLIGDKLVGGLITLSPEYCFVLEDENGICGYVLGALNAKKYYDLYDMAWMLEMCSKYPKPKSKNLTPAEEVFLSFHEYKIYLPNNLHQKYPSLLKMDILPSVEDTSVVKNMLACILSALKANGSYGAFVEVGVGNKTMLDFYTKLGFLEVPMLDEISDEVIILGRAM